MHVCGLTEGGAAACDHVQHAFIVTAAFEPAALVWFLGVAVFGVDGSVEDAAPVLFLVGVREGGG